VVNKFEEFVGVVSIENVVSEILGEEITDEFDNYEDLVAVASSKTKPEHGETDDIPTSEDKEVVE
jgi:CBS domain containing-hemolysin-like protein